MCVFLTLNPAVTYRAQTGEAPPPSPFRRSMFFYVPNTCSIVDIFYDRIFATTTDLGQPRQVIDTLLLALMESSFIYYTKFIVNLVVQSPWTLNTTSITSAATQSVLECNNVLWALKGTFQNLIVSV